MRKMRTMAIPRLVVFILALERRIVLFLMLGSKSAYNQTHKQNLYIIMMSYFVIKICHRSPNLTDHMAVERDEDEKGDGEEDDGHPAEV